MASVTITIPDAIIPRVVAAMRALYPQYGPSGSNLTDVACFKKITADYWRVILATYEADQARQAQETTSTNDASGIG